MLGPPGVCARFRASERRRRAERAGPALLRHEHARPMSDSGTERVLCGVGSARVRQREDDHESKRDARDARAEQVSKHELLRSRQQSITVVAATSVGFSDAVRERRTTSRINARRASGMPVAADGPPHSPLGRSARDRVGPLPVGCGRRQGSGQQREREEEQAEDEVPEEAVALASGNAGRPEGQSHRGRRALGHLSGRRCGITAAFDALL